MHINVSDILAKELGYNRTFRITDERPELDQVSLTAPINGELAIARLDEGLLVSGQITTTIQLECHRCLRSYERPTTVSFRQTFAEAPTQDDMAIAPDGSIDVAELIQQEILVNLPIKLLCRPDCPGIQDHPKDDAPDHSLSRMARITKGP